MEVALSMSEIFEIVVDYFWPFCVRKITVAQYITNIWGYYWSEDVTIF